MEGLRYCSWAPERILRDPIVRRMDAEAFGGYLSLLVEQWLDQEGTLPSDDETLALLSRMTLKTWVRHKAAILSLFHETEGGRLSSEIVSDARDRAVQRSEAAKAAVEERERKRQERLKGEPKQPSTDDPAISEGSSKEKEKENVKDKVKENKPPSSPSGTRKASSGSKPKALQKGNPENAESWARFDAVYPRPSNGRKLERADARLTWDLLVEDGEDMEKVIEGAIRYRDWIKDLDKFQYVAMMTTWFNQRRWEEGYDIDPSSDEGKKIADQREAILRERRSEHLGKFKDQYEAFIGELAETATSSEEYVANWRVETESLLEKRKRLGMTGAIRIVERALEDPEEGRRDRVQKWRSKAEADKTLPPFWDWDKEHNAEAFKP